MPDPHQAIGRLAGWRGLQPVTVEESSAVERGSVHLVVHGIVDGADLDHAIFHPGDRDRPHRQAEDEAIGAVDGINHPKVLAGRRLAATVAELLAQDIIAWKFGRDPITNDVFGVAVGNGDAVLRPLRHDLKRFTVLEHGEREFAGLTGGGLGRFQPCCKVSCHDCSLPEGCGARGVTGLRDGPRMPDFMGPVDNTVNPA